MGPIDTAYLWVPDCTEDIVKERLNMLKEECRSIDSKFLQDKYLQKLNDIITAQYG